MDILGLVGIVVIAAIAWLWIDSLKAREAAIRAAKQACASENLLLLDDTVAIRHMSFGRNSEGQLQLRRVYFFEYSDTGENRNDGSIAMLGSRVLMTKLSTQSVIHPTFLH
jgi:Protein of unknown function (DUF3301)